MTDPDADRPAPTRGQGGARSATDVLIAAARRHARVLREWDADTNPLPLAAACGDGTACDVRCGDGTRPGPNEYEHAEAHFLAALDALSDGALRAKNENAATRGDV